MIPLIYIIKDISDHDTQTMSKELMVKIYIFFLVDSRRGENCFRAKLFQPNSFDEGS